MKDYWLAKLISSVDHVDSRKRLQKSVYLLGLAGCPLQCDYLLHYYGPYSFELAGLIDQLSGAKIVEETPFPCGPSAVGYRSAITEHGKDALSSFEATRTGQSLLAGIQPFIERFGELNSENVWVLELAATVAFYHEDDWGEARRQTSLFRKVPQNNSNLREAVKLARRFKQSA